MNEPRFKQGGWVNTNQEGDEPDPVKAMERDLANAIQGEVPFPETIPQPVDSEFDDLLKLHEEQCTESIDLLKSAIQKMNARLEQYERKRARIRKAQEFEPPKVLNAGADGKDVDA